MGKNWGNHYYVHLLWHCRVLPEGDLAFPSINGLWFWALSQIQKLFRKSWLIIEALTSALCSSTHTHICTQVHTHIHVLLFVGGQSSHLASKYQMAYSFVIAIDPCRPGLTSGCSSDLDVIYKIYSTLPLMVKCCHCHWPLHIQDSIIFIDLREPRARLGYRKQYWTYWSCWCPPHQTFLIALVKAMSSGLTQGTQLSSVFLSLI